MSITVTFAGNNYSVPESGEVGWSSLTDYLVALAGAASATSQLQSVRTSTTTPTTVLSTDWCVLINVASAAAVTLPTGVVKTVYVIADASGAAYTNNITITPSGGQLINGAASYVIKSNRGGVMVQFDGTSWRILAEYQDSQRLSDNNATNASVVDAAIVAKSAVATGNDGQTCTVTLDGTFSYLFTVTVDSSGSSMLLHATESSTAISAISDPDALFLASDSGTGIYVSKLAGDNVISVKNRLGTNELIEIKSLTGRVASATAWA